MCSNYLSHTVRVQGTVQCIRSLPPSLSLLLPTSGVCGTPPRNSPIISLSLPPARPSCECISIHHDDPGTHYPPPPHTMGPSHPVSGSRRTNILRILHNPFSGTRLPAPDTPPPTNLLHIPLDNTAGPHGCNVPLGLPPSRRGLESNHRAARGFLRRDFLWG